MKKVLFIDRDGTIIKEPDETDQIDSLEKLFFIPKVIRTLYLISKNLDFELVMVSNQDGLGTAAYPEERFKIVQEKILNILSAEGIFFNAVYIDKSFAYENKKTRKPNTGMLTKYMKGDYNLAESFVIGDRITDVLLAKNLGCKAILFAGDEKKIEIEKNSLSDVCKLITNDWEEVYSHIALPIRCISLHRQTNETDITVNINLDGRGISNISTGLKFFDHMLSQISSHSGVDLEIKAVGDIDVDEHHTIEDTAIVLGEAISKAIGDKKGMNRYGFSLPMDDSMAQVMIDFGGRAWIVWDVNFERERVGDVPTEMFFHFFKTLSDSAKCNLNIKAEGQNEHHKIEAIFKAFARSLKMAIRRDPFSPILPSSKGLI